jgi:glyoxylase-like metal-dependent hydrolase (beta-lactamase superfamily II)
MERVGFNRLELKEKYKKFARDRVKFKEPSDVNVFIPGNDVFEMESVKIKTIHIPGHSPGQTAFIIENKIPRKSKSDTSNTEHIDLTNNEKILYVADIGSHPYYGDLNSDLKQYKESIDKLESIYLSDKYIMVPAHGNIYFEKEENFFKRIRNKIDKNEKKVINALKETTYKTIPDLVNEHIITPKERIYEPIKSLYLLWDGGKIYHHLNELIEEGLVQKQEENGILSDKYKLK